jgi:AcrB/AcrD/AcrF family
LCRDPSVAAKLPRSLFYQRIYSAWHRHHYRPRSYHDHPRVRQLRRFDPLLLSIALVIAVVFVFPRNGRATLIPAAAVPVSLLGPLCAMYLFGYSLDNLSLMALTSQEA